PFDERGPAEVLLEVGLELLEGVDREPLPDRDHASLGHAVARRAEPGDRPCRGSQVGGEEVLELLRGDPPALEVPVVEGQGALDALSDPPRDVSPALTGVAFRANDLDSHTPSLAIVAPGRWGS